MPLISFSDVVCDDEGLLLPCARHESRYKVSKTIPGWKSSVLQYDLQVDQESITYSASLEDMHRVLKQRQSPGTRSPDGVLDELTPRTT